MSSRLLGSPHFKVGYPLTPFASQSGLPSAVQSTSAMSAVSESANASISLSQSGFIFLQCPHQGAKNLMNTVFPATESSKLSGVNSIALATTRRLRKIDTIGFIVQVRAV